MFARWRKRYRCLHHDPGTGTSWIMGMLIDMGMRKMLWCTRCQKTWFV